MLPSPCGLRPQGRAATAPQWPLTCTIENQFVHKFLRILDKILKSLETFRNALRPIVQQVARTCATSCKRAVYDVCLLRTTSVLVQNDGSRVGLLFLLTRLCFEQTSCSDRRHRRAAVRALSLQDRPGLQPIWPGSLAGWRSLGSDCLRRRARPASRAGRSSHGLGAPDVPG